MSQRPLHLFYDSNIGFELTVITTFNKLAYEKMPNGNSYQKEIQSGVITHWSGSYYLNSTLRQACNNFFQKYCPNENENLANMDQINFSINFQIDPLSVNFSPRLLYIKRLFSKHKRPIPIYVKKLKIMPSHVASGFFRRFWGFFKYFKIVTFGFNWSRNFPGYAVINQSANSHTLKSLAAHEFGHLFGLDDAYDAWYRFYYAAPETENYMMHYNKEVQSEEIAMLINAYTQNRIQFFPIKFNFKTIQKGFRTEIKYYRKKLKKFFSFE